MTSQEKMNWFWTFGEVPGSVFDDIQSGKSQGQKQPLPDHNKDLHPDLRAWRRMAGKDNSHS